MAFSVVKDVAAHQRADFTEKLVQLIVGGGCRQVVDVQQILLGLVGLVRFVGLFRWP